VELYPPKLTFSENNISSSKECCATKFLHTLENDQVLLAHPYRGWGSPLRFFFQCGVKNPLKMQRMSVNIFGTRESSLTKLCHVTYHVSSYVVVIICRRPALSSCDVIVYYFRASLSRARTSVVR